MKIRILQTMVSGIPLVLFLRTRIHDPCVYVVCEAPMLMISNYCVLFFKSPASHLQACDPGAVHASCEHTRPLLLGFTGEGILSFLSCLCCCVL